jgi:hypothetical protein
VTAFDTREPRCGHERVRVTRGIGATRWRHHWRASCFSESPFLTGGRWPLRGKQRGCSLLAPALLASELWAVLGWLVPAGEREAPAFLHGAKSSWFHLRPGDREAADK